MLGWLIFTVLLCTSHGAYNSDDLDENQEKSKVLPSRPVPKASLKLLFHDDFNTLDRTQWTPDASASQSWGNHKEFEFYTPESRNCYTHGGILYLRPTLTADRFGEDFLHHGVLDIKKLYGYCSPTWSNGCYRDASKDGIMPPTMSCKVSSKFAFKYGKLEIVARMPVGDWLWPGLWLIAKHPKYGPWPRSGEIDLAELTGNLHYGKLGVQRTTATLIFGDSADQRKHLRGQHWLESGNYGDRFRKYTLDWTASHLNMYVDDVLIYGLQTPSDGMHHHFGLTGPNIYGNSHNAPFDQELYIIMNVAVGGMTMFSDRVENQPYPKPWLNTDDSKVAMEKFWRQKSNWYKTWHGEKPAMAVDSVTVWAY